MYLIRVAFCSLSVLRPLWSVICPSLLDTVLLWLLVADILLVACHPNANAAGMA